MSKLSYLARVMSGVRLKKMNQMIDVVHDKCGQNKVRPSSICAGAAHAMGRVTTTM